MELRLKVLTLNCWGLAVISSDRKKRILAIANELASGEYDFVVLQEVWVKADYQLIVNQTQHVLPYTYYFYSGVIGSGLCVFSKVRLIEVQYLPFRLNGYVHKVHHGDWFSGKGVGMCRVNYEGLDINIFTAHLHAEYDRLYDQYLPHRLCQAFDFSQFVKGRATHINIVAGDFNAEPTDLPIQILCRNGELKDAFIEQEKSYEDELGATNYHIRNTYTPNSLKNHLDPGKRIDYILYNHSQGIDIKVLSCTTPLDKCPGDTISLSDHEAVVASLLITKTPHVVAPKDDEEQSNGRKTTFFETKHILDGSIRQLTRDKIFYNIVGMLFLCLAFGTMGINLLPFNMPSFIILICIISSTLMVFCFWMGWIWNSMERNCIVATVNAINLLLEGV